jgi:hypothetical protein
MAVDEDHAWRVAGDSPKGKKRMVIQPAFWHKGRLLSTLPEAAKKLAKNGVVGYDTIRTLHCTFPETPAGPMGPKIVEGERITPDYDAPLTGKSVVLLGGGISRWHAELFMEGEAELWTINDERHEQATRHFQVHADLFAENYGNEYIDTSDLDIPVYTQETFPFDEVRRVWLNSTLDYLLAMADKDGFSTIYMPGIDFGGERTSMEIESAKYWFGVLEGKGAKIHYSPLFNGFNCEVYGRDPYPYSGEYHDV